MRATLHCTVFTRSNKPILEVSRDDLIWLAGWWEGEGCFTGKDGLVIMSAVSTDFDVAERVAKILGAKTRNQAKAELHHKDRKCVVIQGDIAKVWMLRLYPLMGERRKAKIKELLVRT